MGNNGVVKGEAGKLPYVRLRDVLLMLLCDVILCSYVLMFLCSYVLMFLCDVIWCYSLYQGFTLYLYSI